MIVDTHCHYNLEPLYVVPATEQVVWQPHWQKAQQSGVCKSIIVGVNFFTSGTAVNIAQQETNLFAAVGCHPTIYTDRTQEKLRQFPNTTLDVLINEIQTDRSELSLITDNKKVVAIGEIGLDYYHLNEAGFTDDQRNFVIEVQKRAFQMQVELAKDSNLPIIVHVRDTGEQAYHDTLEILRQTQFTNPFVLHCISGPLEYVKLALQMGAFVGMAGNITYKNAAHIRELVKAVDPEHLLLETDAPYLPPEEFRGQVCEPWMISKTAEYVQQELGISVDQLTLNAETLFRI